MLRKIGFIFIMLSLLITVGCNISGTVKIDETGVDGVTVILNSNPEMTTETDKTGNYSFDMVDAGTYVVTIKPPEGYTRSVNRKVTKENKYTSVSNINFFMNSETVRTLETGQVIGFKEDNGSLAWLGIPYAKTERWKAPKSAESWGTDFYMALETGPICAQFAGLLIDSTQETTNGMVGCEECQFLNLWTPENAQTNGPLPVMVWIHGGGNSIGEGGNYNGKNLAAEQDVILITFNYRLGPFGWFTHPALKSGDDLDDSGNYGILDIIRVLRWVQNNISAFGGDKNNVTVFGESAGAQDTLCMVISGEATDLFHKGIAESGGIGTTEMYKGQNYSDDLDPEKQGHSYSSREVVNKLLISDGTAADRLSAISAQNTMEAAGTLGEYLNTKSTFDILGVYEGGYGGMIPMPKIFRDGTVLPLEDPLDLFAAGDYNKVPLIMGTNRDESKLFMILDTNFVDLLGSIPFRAKDEAYYALYSSYNSDATKAYAVDNLATILSEVPGQPPVYAYRFDWDEEPTVLGINMSLLLGAAHGLEISFVFNNFSQFIVPEYASLVYTNANEPGRVALAESMSSYWAEFAYAGTPYKGKDEAEVTWTPWDNAPGEDKTIIFDTEADGGIYMTNFTITPESLKYRLIAEPGFPTQEQHCEMYMTLFEGSELWDDDEYANLGKEGCGN